jgi:predicted nucleic acid-binding protein
VTVLVDSDILIEVSRGRDFGIVEKWTELGKSDALILFSPVTAAELWAGARPVEYAFLEGLFDALVCVPTDESVGRRAGEYLRRYRKSHAVELGDALIAASAVASGARLWTRNRKHYPMPELTYYE